MSYRKGFLRPKTKSSTSESSFSLIIVVVCRTTDWRSEFGLFLIYLPVSAPLPPSLVFCPSLQTFITLTNLPLFFLIFKWSLYSAAAGVSLSPPSVHPFLSSRGCSPRALSLAHFLSLGAPAVSVSRGSHPQQRIGSKVCWRCGAAVWTAYEHTHMYTNTHTVYLHTIKT